MDAPVEVNEAKIVKTVGATYLVDPTFKDGKVVWYTVTKTESDDGRDVGKKTGGPKLYLVIGEPMKVGSLVTDPVEYVGTGELDFCSR